MSTSVVIPDALENISQRYIEQLRNREKRAKEDLVKATTQLDTNQKAYNEALAWETTIDDYWARVKNSDKKFQDAHRLIMRLEKLADIITENVGLVSEAVETLVCVVREMSKETDSLKIKVTDFQNRLSTAPNKANPYLKKIDELQTLVEASTGANTTAIRDVLELLKEIFLLRISLEGKVEAKRIRIKLEERWSYIEVGHEVWMEFYHKIVILEYLTSKENVRSLAANVHNLHELLHNDRAFPLSKLSDQEKEHLPFPLREPEEVPTFPLIKEQYYRSTQSQQDKAEDKREATKRQLDDASSNHKGAEARHKAVEAALKAAEDAKKATT
jgi:hypothetical protein